MSYENDFQMHFVGIGLEEGIRRGEVRALCRVAGRMKAMGLSRHAAAMCLGVSESLVDALAERCGPYRGIYDDFISLEFTKDGSDVIL